MKIGHTHDAAVSHKADKPSTARKPEAAHTASTVSAGQTAAQSAAAAAAASKANAPEASAQVAISATAAKLVSKTADDGSFDTAKVDRISKAISEGKFQVDANAIADKLIANAQELVSRANRQH